MATRRPPAISVIAHRLGNNATPSLSSTARLMPSRLGSEITIRSGMWRSSNNRNTRSRAGDGSLWAMTASLAMSSITT